MWSHTRKVPILVGLDEDGYTQHVRQQRTNLLRVGPGVAGHPHNLLSRRRWSRWLQANPRGRPGRGEAQVGGEGR